MEDNIKVIICCLAYNHEKYIREMLEGIVSQKTTFRFKAIIQDDKSTDNTADIIREYEKEYPDIFCGVYQSENQYSKGEKSYMDFLIPYLDEDSVAYVAFCEGDDYWCDEYKLQKQFDAMEQNPECSICAHLTQLIREDGRIIKGAIASKKINKHLKTNIIDSQFCIEKFFSTGLWISHGASNLIRSSLMKKLLVEKPDFWEKCPVGDEPLILYAMINGNAYFIKEVMSVYRVFSSNSWTSRLKNANRESVVNHFESKKISFEYFNSYTDYAYDKIIKLFELRTDFVLCRRFREYGKIKDKKYNELFKTLDIKNKIAFIILRYFSFLYVPLENIYKKIKQNL